MTPACAQVSITTTRRPRTTAGLVPFTSKGGRTVAPCRGSKRNVQTPAWFNFGKPKALEEKVKRETIIPEPSYSIPVALTGITGLSAVEGNLVLAGVTGFLAAFLAFQASRVQFVFDDEALEVLIKSNESENKFVGGRNRWEYDSFTNWEFWWKKFPVLVYFKVKYYHVARCQHFLMT
ncbi:hypothetical protein ABBQ32_010541 [Trebouxia sp. C0010 RCD-2024]